MGATGADLRRGQLSAWLQKKKSGSAMVRVRQYNRRYFTMDFDSRTFYYTHAENSKKVSSVIPFAEIVDVRLPDSQVDRGDNASECSRQSKVSWMRRLGSGAKLGEEAPENVLTVMTRPAKTMELLCSSAAEAVEWYEAFKAAMADGGGGADGDVVCGPGTPSSGEGLPARDAGAACTAASAADYASERSASGVAATKEAPEVTGRRPTAAPEASQVAGGAAAAGEAVPPPPKGTFLDLSMDLEAAPAARPRGVEDAAVTNLSPGGLEASAFGFDGEESAGSSAASSPAGTPRGSEGAGPGLEAAALAGGGSQPGSRPATGRRSYADQHEGLSMKERLANLEFSDAEDDDDDPLGLGRAG